ncbi:MAG: DUF6394 family protein [Sulfuricurvum sp.]
MYSEKVISGFFIILALTLNFGFVYGDLHNLELHSKYELMAAIVVNLIATTMKLGDKTQMGSVLLATSFVADIQLIASALVWGGSAIFISEITPAVGATIISLAAGALVANIVSVFLFIGETLMLRR